MLLDVLAKVRLWYIYTFFTCSATEFEWPYIIQVIACQYGKELPDEQINAMH